MSGVGGEVDCYVEEALVAFVESGKRVHVYEVRLDIVPGDPAYHDDCPSLLGRDILRHWSLIHDPSRSRLRATVRYSDTSLPIAGSP